MERDERESESPGERLSRMDEILEMLENEMMVEYQWDRDADDSGVGSRFISAIKCAGRPILPPLMTASRKEEMQMYKRQAVLSEGQRKARARHILLARVQSALDSIQVRRSPSSTLNDSDKTLTSTLGDLDENRAPAPVETEGGDEPHLNSERDQNDSEEGQRNSDEDQDNSDEGQDTESDKQDTVYAALPHVADTMITPETSPMTSPRGDSAIDSPNLNKTDTRLKSSQPDDFQDIDVESPAKASPRSESRTAPDSGISSQAISTTPALDAPLPEEVLDTMAEITDIEDDDGTDAEQDYAAKNVPSHPWVLHKLSNTPVKSQGKEQDSKNDSVPKVAGGLKLSSTSSSSGTTGSSEEINRTVILCEDSPVNSNTNTLLDAATTGPLMDSTADHMSDVLMHPMEQLLQKAKLSDSAPPSTSDLSLPLHTLETDVGIEMKEIESPNEVEMETHQTQTDVTMGDEPISTISLLSKVNFSDDEDTDEESDDSTSHPPPNTSDMRDESSTPVCNQDSGFLSSIQSSAVKEAECSVAQGVSDSAAVDVMQTQEVITPGPSDTPDVSQIEAVTLTNLDEHLSDGAAMTPPGQGPAVPTSTLKSQADSSNTSSQLGKSCGAASTVCTESTNLSRYMTGSLETIESSTTTLPFIASMAAEFDGRPDDSIANSSENTENKERTQIIDETAGRPESAMTGDGESSKTDIGMSKEGINTVLMSCRRHIRKGSYTLEQPSFSEGDPDITVPTVHQRPGSYTVEQPSFTEAELPTSIPTTDKYESQVNTNPQIPKSPIDCLKRGSYTLDQPSPVLVAAKSQQQKREEQLGQSNSQNHLTMSMEDLQLRPVSRQLKYESDAPGTGVSPLSDARYKIHSDQHTPEKQVRDPLSHLFQMHGKKSDSTPSSGKSGGSRSAVLAPTGGSHRSPASDGKTEHLHRYLQNLSQMPPPHLTSSPNQTLKSKETSPISLAASSIHSVTSQEFIPNVLQRKVPVRHSHTRIPVGNNSVNHNYSVNYAGNGDSIVEGEGDQRENIEVQDGLLQLAYIEQMREKILQQQREELAAMMAEQQQQQLLLQQQILQQSALLGGQLAPAMAHRLTQSSGLSGGFPLSTVSSQASSLQPQPPLFDSSHISMGSASLTHPALAGFPGMYPNLANSHNTTMESQPQAKSRGSKNCATSRTNLELNRKSSPDILNVQQDLSNSQLSILHNMAGAAQRLPCDASSMNTHRTQRGEPSSLSSTVSTVTSDCNLSLEQQSMLSEYLGTNLDQLNNLSTQHLLQLVADANARASVERPVSAPVPKVHFKVSDTDASSTQSGVNIHYYTPEKFYRTPENSYLASPEVSTVRKATPSKHWPEGSPASKSVRHPPQAYCLSPLEMSRIRVHMDVHNLPSWALRGFVKLTALVRGYLTRRLLHSQKIQDIIKTIRDTAEFAINFQQESPIKRGVYTSQDRVLQERVLNQLTAAMYEIHEVFFELSTAEQMALIAQTRALEHEHEARPSPVSQEKRPLSAASRKTMERRRKAHAAEMAMLAHVRPKSAPPCRSENSTCTKSHDLSGAIRRNYQYIISRALRPIQAQASPVRPNKDHRLASRDAAEPVKNPLVRKVSTKTKKQHPAAPVRKTASTVTNSKRTTQTQAKPTKVTVNQVRPVAMHKPSLQGPTAPWK